MGCNMKRRRKDAFDDWRDEVLQTIWDLNAATEGASFPELAAEAGLAATTVWRLAAGITKDPKARTIFKLCKAVGLWMSVVEEIRQKHRRAG